MLMCLSYNIIIVHTMVNRGTLQEQTLLWQHDTGITNWLVEINSALQSVKFNASAED